MGTERDRRKITECLCGQGTVDEDFWADDYPFARDLSWHSSGITLRCENCSAHWVARESVANPVTTTGNQRVIYFVRKGEIASVAAHNDEVDKQISVLWQQERQLRELLAKKLHELKAELLQLLDRSGTRLASRFGVIGSLVGLTTIEAFRHKVRRTLPKTYIPKLVTERNMSEVFERMGRARDVQRIRETRDELLKITQRVDELKVTKRSPMAVEHRRIAPKVLLPGRGVKEWSNDTLCQKSGYPGRNG